MKTKHKINFKILWGTIALCFAIVVSAFCLNFIKQPSANALTNPGFSRDETNGFTGVDSNGLVFNIEKVGVLWDDTGKKTQSFDGASVLAGGGYEDEDKQIYYKTISGNGSNLRYAVRNNEFVMLNSDSGSEVQSSAESKKLDETIIISFGQYYFENGQVVTAKNKGYNSADKSTGAGIGLVTNSVITINGKTIQNDDETYGSCIYYRHYDNDYGDFAFVLPKNAEEGYYTIQLNYSFGNITDYGGDGAKFGFYLVRESSYTKTYTEYESEQNNKNIYTAKPTLTRGRSAVSGAGDQISGQNNQYTYILGSNLDYPTLTYDYTRYSLSYTYFANERTLTYTYTYNAASQSLDLNITDLNGALVNNMTFALANFVNDQNAHLATIVLTDYGRYNFSFGYIYTGYNRNNAPLMENLTITGFQLDIVGVESVYARTNASVQFKYIKFAANSNLVDLIVPSGYTDKSQPETNKIHYSTNKGEDNASKERVGNTIKADSYDTNLGQNFQSKPVSEWAQIFGDGQTDELTNASSIKTFIENVDYTHLTTNLGSVKFYSNYRINFNKSFFFRADDRNFVGEIFNGEENLKLKTDGSNEILGKTKYDETTFLNKTGYYIVFLNVLEDGKENGSYQMFAYRYNQDSIKANIVGEDSGETIMADGYTKENVKISWQEAGVFEQEISVNYSTSHDAANQDGYVYGNSIPLSNGEVLGQQVQGDYMHYKVVVDCPGISNEPYTFTIDRSPISNIALYEAELTTNQFNRPVYQYRFLNGSRVKLDITTFAITSQRFAIDWDAKLSGASVTAEYLFVPFVETETEVKEMQVMDTLGKNQLWITNKWQADLSNIEHHVFSDGLRLVERQGIYLFVITDQAGNSTRYMYVIDNSEAYFKVQEVGTEEGSYLTRELHTYSGDVIITTGTHKAIAIVNGEINDEVGDKLAFKQLVAGNYRGEYFNSSVNISKLTNLFGTAQEARYLAVKNYSLTAYNYVTNVKDDALGMDQTYFDQSYNQEQKTTSKTMSFSEEEKSTSMIRSFYLLGENNKNNTDMSSNSYIVLEINKDNSRGEVYYFNTQLTINEGSSYNDLFANKQQTNRLITGKDISAAEATKDNYVYFVWNNGNPGSETEVESISYQRYELNLNKADDVDLSNNFYYTAIGNPVEVYKNGTFTTNAGKYDTTRGYALIGYSAGSSVDGLYVVTRTYKQNGTASDAKELKYYFIIDRNGIMSNGIGSGIYFGLFNNKVKYNNFNTTTQTEQFNYREGEGLNEQYYDLRYPVYLNADNTLRLPATINVPTQKYFKQAVNANYLANSLYISVWFNDIYSQLPTNSSKSVKLFEYNQNTQNDAYISDGYFKINLSQQADRLGNQLLSRFMTTDGQNDWLTLPGDYVVVITDAVKSSTSVNRQLLGFRISLPNALSGAKADISASTDDHTQNANFDNLRWSTNKDKITITIPKANLINQNANEIFAQTDPYYFEITQTISERNMMDQSYTFYYRHGTQTGNGQFASVSDGENMVVTLANNAELNQTITYTIKLRWESDTIGSNRDAFENCYYYYEPGKNSPTYYFVKTYTIVVDRQAPINNITYLQNNDGVLTSPFNQFYTEQLFIDSTLGGNHIKVYSGWQNGAGEQSSIYAFIVSDNTPYSTDDISNIYVKNWNNGYNIQLGSLEYANFVGTGYTRITKTPNNFGDLFEQAGYYEIIEQDDAGNFTQYVVFYDGGNEDRTEYDNLTLTLQINDILDQQKPYTFNTNNQSVEVFKSLTVPSENAFNYQNETSMFDRFYRFELARLDQNGNVLGFTKHINTNLTSQFTNSGLAAQIVDMFKDGDNFTFGNYRLSLFTRTETKVFYINFYRTSGYTINAEELVDKQTYNIDFSRAIRSLDGVMYHASEIMLKGGNTNIKRVFKFNEQDNLFYEWFDENEDGVFDDSQAQNPTSLLSNLDGTYLLIVTSFGKKSGYRFDTTNNTEFDRVVFAGEKYYDVSQDIYYTFNNTTIFYNTTFYDIDVKYSIFGSEFKNIYTFENYSYQGANYRIIDFADGRINIYPFFANKVGAKLEVICTLNYLDDSDDDAVPSSYHIVIDTRTAYVENLSASGEESNIMAFNFNVEDILSTNYASIGTGERFLIFRAIDMSGEAVNYSYNYQMFVEENNGSLTEIYMENERFLLIPDQSNTGIYRFVITANIVAEGQTLRLGNVVYTFILQQDTSVFIPFIIEENGRPMQANSFVTIGEILGDASFGNLSRDIIAEQIVNSSNMNMDGLGSATSKDDIHLPDDEENIKLFISNKTLTVHPYGECDAFGNYTTTFDNYILTLYRLLKDSEEYYVATLVVPRLNNFIGNDILVNGGTYIHQQTWIGEKFEISFVGNNYNPNATIKNKNTNFVSLYFYNQFVSSQAIDFNNAGTASTTIVGNGEYSLRFTDLAGNTNMFTFTLGGGNASQIETEQLSLTTLNNAVAVLVNGQAPINKAFYNGEVTITVQSLAAYGADRNNIVYNYRYNSPSADVQTISDLSSRRFSYTFSLPGWYSVQIVCPRQNGEQLVSNLEFTIIEPSEAYPSFSFGAERTEQIVQVTNRENMTLNEINLLTTAFKDLLKENEYRLDYSKVVSAEYASKLNIANTFGRQTFDVTYRVDEGVYPARQVTFRLSLNNMQPNIDCTLKAGEGSTKGFTINYNLGEIYNQIGSSSIYVYKDRINDSNAVVIKIDATSNSANEIASSRVVRAGTQSDGNYYIVLKTSSGRIVSSYGVKITQPLNTWAIIVIVVISIIVIAVVVTIILLRTKMRIR